MLKQCWLEGLYWQGLTHDLSKFLPDEFFGSALFFEGAGLTDEQRERAQVGLLKHYHRNPHHPEHWLLKPGRVLPMPRRYLLELLCDWRALADNPESVKAWYVQNRDEFVFHPETRAELETLLQVAPARPATDADRTSRGREKRNTQPK